ncbi:hypothetical protein [Paractinoplanes maris]|uniref:hypothetical protein n=1 Tax=Paractinoplanes maris TaxID=1734446 RepID=UPI00202169B9|nr:hypothetical protein [Actinoplanes maris]
MNPDLNEQPRRSAWPNPVDTALDRARRVAGMYRAHLRMLDLDACNRLDDTVAAFGETWMLDKPDIVDPDREVTTAEAAELVKTTPKRIREWACQLHPDKPDEPLLPRFKMRGRERTYLAGHVLAAAAWMRQRSSLRE